MWPNESREYRQARDKLAAAESELRARAEAVARMRRDLPDGGAPVEDYVFERVPGGEAVRLSELFGPGRDTLVLYSFMYAPDGKPCPMCTSMLDSLDRSAPQIERKVSLAVAAKAGPERLTEFAKSRGWRNLRLISSGKNNYNADYRGEAEDGSQLPVMHVWVRRDDGVRHFWASELLFRDDPDWQGQPRHVDMIWPLWNVLDMTPEGRGEDWYPKL